MRELCVGLFGTGGGSTWRDEFIAAYDRQGIAFFNPQVEDWTPQCAAVEARHLASDAVVLFPITGESYGLGSLVEVGFASLQAQLSGRDFVVHIASELHDTCADASLANESRRARQLAGAHLAELRIPTLHVVAGLAEMLDLSVALYRSAARRA